MSPADRRAIAAEYIAGSTMQQIGDRRGVTRQRIHQIIKTETANDRIPPTLTRDRKALYAPRLFSPETRAKALATARAKTAKRWPPGRMAELKNLLEEGQTFVQLAKRYGVTKGVIAGMVFRAGFCQSMTAQ